MRYVELDTLTIWLLVNLIDLYIVYSKVGFLIFLNFRVSFGVQYIYWHSTRANERNKRIKKLRTFYFRKKYCILKIHVFQIFEKCHIAYII